MKRLAVIFLVLVGVALAATVAGIFLAERGDHPFSSRPTVLVWRVDGPLPEQAAVEPFPFAGGGGPSIARLYAAFRSARSDDSVRGVAVYIQNTPFGLAKAQELRQQLRRMHDAKKFVECYLETAGEGSNGTLAYYLATACDHVALAPAGDLNLLGLYLDSVFYRGSLDKLKVVPDFSHVGKYKSAVETYTRSERSAAAEEAVSRVLDSFYDQVVGDIAQARALSPEKVAALIDDAPYDAQQALVEGLVDQLAYPDEFRRKIDQLGGGDPLLLPIDRYHRRSAPSGPKIAVVVAEGTIVRGAGGVQPWTETTYLGSDDLTDLLRDLAENDSIKAVILRIDSPGGSALASDLILHAVDRLRKRKPVVASMSDVAASGGYYIAAKASRIVAEPATLTGSIGVLSGKLVTKEFQAQLLGITHDTLKRGANADLYSSLTTFSPHQAERVQALMNRVYQTFVGHVADGRGLATEEVEKVAEGRVWSGADAAGLGLVDDLGGLDRAVELARDAAGLGAEEDVRLLFLPEPQSFLDFLLEQREPSLPASLVELARALDNPPPGLLQLSPDTAGLSAPF